MNNLIFVIDEDLGIKIAFEKILKQENFVISTFSRPEKMLSFVKQKKPKVVILNIKIPERAGIELLHQIKKIHPHLPVIVMTAYSNILTEKDSLKFGADDYLKKPFEVETMLTKLKRLTHTKFSEKSDLTESEGNRENPCWSLNELKIVNAANAMTNGKYLGGNAATRTNQ